MTVGLVLVSHSAALARGVAELAREMGGGDVRVELAGGMAEPEGAIGTDAELVRGAIERAAAGGGGVLVLMDLGSAVMSAELAVEMVDGVEVVLSDAPLVEGAVAAAARAGAGADLAEVAAEARRAPGMKAAQLGTADEPAAPPVAAEGAAEARLAVTNVLGLHARPAARVAALAATAEVTLANETTGAGPVDARSLIGLMSLGARRGHTLVARGPEEVLAALRELAATNFGDDDAARPRARPGSEPAVEPEAPPEGTLRGVAASPGVAIGPVRRGAAVEVHDAPAGDPESELRRLAVARAAARDEVRAARDRVGSAEAGILDALALLLDDAALVGPAESAVRGGTSAGVAWRDATDAAAATYRTLDDPYLRERAADVEDAGTRVLRHLAAATDESAAAVASTGDAAPSAPGILVARDLLPGDAAGLDPATTLGVALARGGATSHAAILARALGVPAVAGLGDGILGLAPGTRLVLDGTAGTVEVDPPAAALDARRREQAAAAARAADALAHAAEPARTTDGARVEVAANLGAPEEAARAVELGADGVGLLRTEFLFLDRPEPPAEEEQREIYARIAATLAGRPLIVRTLDAGADKPLPFLPQPPEDNPFLGVRGLRLGLARPEILRAQLRAVAAVAGDHPVKVMFPMVSTLAELRRARELLREAGGAHVPAGAMVEVPALALQAEAFAAEADFLSVGTNDLTQYTMAAERGNGALAALVEGPVPAVLRLIARVTAAAGPRGTPVGVCGELAGDPAAAVLLAGLGVGELSMAPARIPEVKAALRTVALAAAREAARAALDAEDAAAARALGSRLLG